MKIKTAFLLSALFFTAAPCPAQLTVVRVDGPKVYLDTSVLNRNVTKGETFKIILSSERLVNPKTGKDLGPVYTYSPEGKITEVQPLYAVGELPKGVKTAVGQEAVLAEISPAAEPEPAVQNAQPGLPALKQITYEPIEQTVVSLSAAAVSAPGAENVITLSEKGQVTVWNAQDGKLVQKLAYQIPASKTPLTVSAYAARGQKTAEIFVTVYDASREKIFTLVLANQNGALEEIQTLPYFVKELGCGQNKTLWAQKPFVSGSRPGNARGVIYKNGKLAANGKTLNTRRNWLTGVNFAPAENESAENFFYTASNGVIRMTRRDGKQAQSKSLFAAAPNRVKYKQEILKFYPSVQVFGPDGNVTVAAAENTTRHGLLSETFGQYQNGKIHFMSFEKGRLNVTATAELDGFVYDTACSGRSVLAAGVLPDGTSSVTEIFK